MILSRRWPLSTADAGMTNRWILACVAIGLALRLAFALLYWVDRPLTHDEREYLALGRSVARGEGFRYPADEPSPGTAQQFGRAPGYPLFLAALRVTDPQEHAPRRVQIVQTCIGAAGIWLIAAIAGRAAGRRAAAVAAAVAAVYPPLVVMPAYVLSETVYSTVALAAALVLTATNKGDNRIYLRKKAVVPFLGGSLTGFGILVRPAMLFFLPFAAGWLIWRSHKQSVMAGIAHAAVFSVAALACVAPWTLRNHRVHGRWIAIASEGGVTFWTGNHPLSTGDGDLAANPDLKRAELAFRGAHPDLSAEQLEPLYYRDALSWIRRDPGAWLALLARKVFYSVVPIGPSYAVHSARYRAAAVVSYLLVLPAAVVGAWRWRRDAQTSASPSTELRAGPVPLWLMAAATVAAGMVFFPQERFRLPVIDPALIVTAALPAGVRKR